MVRAKPRYKVSANSNLEHKPTATSQHVLCRAQDENALEVDFGAFNHSTPHLTLPSSIGNGLSFITKFLSSKLHEDSETSKLFLDYLLNLRHGAEVRTLLTNKSMKSSKLINIVALSLQKLMINDTLNSVDKLQTALLLAEVFVSGLNKNMPFAKFAQRLS